MLLQGRQFQRTKGLAAFALALLSAAQAQTDLQVVLVDNLQSQYIAQGPFESTPLLSPEGAACIEASLLGLPCTSGNAGASAQAELVLKADIFVKPEALIAVQIAGQMLGELNVAGDRPSHHEVLASGFTALELSTSLQAVTAPSTDTLHVYRADFANLSGCSDACMETLLQEALLAVGGNYSAGTGGPMQGLARVWQSKDAGARAVDLDLMCLPVRLWAAELAVLHHAAADLAAEKARRDAQGSPEDGRVWLLEGTLVSLQALSQAAEITEAQQLGAELAMQSIVGQAQDMLSHAFTDRVATVAALLGSVPDASKGFQDLLQWRASSSQALLSRDVLGSLGGTLPTGGRDSLNWQTDAAAWLSFIIIVVLLAAAINFLSKMQFKKDSLLYGRAKAD